MKRIRPGRIAAVLFSGIVLAAGFQNCTPMKSDSKSTAGVLQNTGGDGYTGKTGLYRDFDEVNRCADLDRDGNPLPTRQIFFQSKTVGETKKPYVVRENCRDIVPELIAPKAAKFDAAGNLNFNGRAFANYQANADFQVLAASCPAGKSPVAGAARKNLIVNSQDWTEQPVYQGWMWHSGILANLNGSIMSLPAYSLVRTDPKYPEEFRRISQLKQLKSNTEYAVSFLAKRGTKDILNFAYHRVDNASGREEYLKADFNLAAGTSSVRFVDFLPPVSVRMVPVGDGYFCTIYFKTSATGGENFSEFGFAPAAATNGSTKVGDSVYASAAQLEETGGFCR